MPMEKINPLKKFGQNYLVDKNILNKIVMEIDPKPDDIIIEIGPGTGALTAELSKRVNSFTAVEIDSRVIEELRNRHENLNLIEADFLKTDLQSLIKDKRGKMRVVGNIPYNITSPIVFRLIENASLIEDAVFMIQYEVARRFTAERGSKDYGILAVILKYFAEVQFCFKVSPNVFYPRPKVDSAVVHIRFRDERDKNIDEKLFIKLVKAAFGNRRKTLKNSLNNSIFGEFNFENSGIDLSLRAEQLELNDFVTLTGYLQGEIYARGKKEE